MTKSPQPRAGSLIVALHARFEQLDMHAAIADATQPGCVDERYHALGVAMSDISTESDLVRRSLLWQPIVDDWELSIVAFHLQDLIDDILMRAGNYPGLAADQEAAAQASRAMFGYLVSERRLDLDIAGRRTRDAAIRLHGTFLDRGGEPPEAAS